MRTQREINEESIQAHLKNAWKVAIFTHGKDHDCIKAIEDAMELCRYEW